MARYTHAQRQVLSLLQSHPAISYTDLAAHLHIDPDTARIAIRQLELTGRIRTQKGSGRTPNRYEVLT